MLLSNPDYGLSLWVNLNITKVPHVQCREARVFTKDFNYEISSHHILKQQYKWQYVEKHFNLYVHV